MSADDILALAQKSADSDLAFLLKAKEESKRRMRADPSPENINAFNKAKSALETEMAKTQKQESSGGVLGSILKVEAYLTAAGWKVKKSKLYQDKKKGLLKMQPDGTVLKADADAYAAAHLAPADAAPDAEGDDILRMRRELLAEELMAAKQKRERVSLRMQKDLGELIPRSEVDAVLIAAVSVYRTGLKQWIYTRMPELVELVAGDPKKIEEAIHFMLAESNLLFQGFSRARAAEVLDGGTEDDDPDLDDAEESAA